MWMLLADFFTAVGGFFHGGMENGLADFFTLVWKMDWQAPRHSSLRIGDRVISSRASS
jgi:hypothetical protein